MRLRYFSSVDAGDVKSLAKTLENILQQEHGVDGRHQIASASQDGFLSASDYQKFTKLIKTVFPQGISGGGGGGGGTVATVVDYIIKMESDANDNPIYIGRANPGTPTSAAGWQIRKFGYAADGFPISITYASGVSSFTNIWDNRALLSYS